MSDFYNHITGLVQAEITRLIEFFNQCFISVKIEFISDYIKTTRGRTVPAAYPVWLVYDDFKHRPAAGRRIQIKLES